MKLGLGTVQFGIDYGISNCEGIVSKSEVAKILEEARQCGIEILDTAYLYGDSELILGLQLKEEDHFKIVTKTIAIKQPVVRAEDILLFRETFHQSLRKLKKKKVYGLLLHNVEDLFAEKGELLIEEMLNFKAQGLVEKIGISIYTGHQIDYILGRYNIDLVQLPINVLDQRLIAAGYLDKLKSHSIEIHARSIFLQGLLLTPPDQLDQYFYPVQEHLNSYRDFLGCHGLTPIEGAISFISKIEEIDHVIVGVVSCDQLLGIKAAMAKQHNLDFSPFAWNDKDIVDPSMWKIN